MAAHSFRVTKTANQTGIGAAVKVTFDSIDYDVGGGWDPTNNRWTVGPGLYLVTACIEMGSVTNIDARMTTTLRIGSGVTNVAVDSRYNRVTSFGNMACVLSALVLVTAASENFEAWTTVDAGTGVADAACIFSGLKMG